MSLPFAFSQVNNSDLSNMTMMFERMGLVNGWVCMALGLPLNLLLIWVVASQSPKELRVYKKVLISTAVIDLWFLTMCFLVTPVSQEVKSTHNKDGSIADGVRCGRVDDHVRPWADNANGQLQLRVEQRLGGHLAVGYGAGSLTPFPSRSSIVTCCSAGKYFLII